MRVALVAACALLGSGCAVGRFLGIALQSGRAPIAQTEVVERASPCVIVFLPGMGDRPERFRQHGFVDVVEADPAGAPSPWWTRTSATTGTPTSPAGWRRC